MTNGHTWRGVTVALVLIGSVSLTRPLHAVAQNPPATPIPTYDVRVDVDQTYTGTTTFAADQSGKVSGTMHLDSPAAVDAKLSGVVKDGTWTFDYEFSMPDQGCAGRASGTAKVSADGSTISGNIAVGGDCVQQPQSGSFSFTRKK